MRAIVYNKIRNACIWLKRFRHRRGYGVHSPFAFNLITNVFYEKSAYYAYKTLLKFENEEKKRRDKDWVDSPIRVRRMLFRLVNYSQPQQIIYIGKDTSTLLYLQAGCQKASLVKSADMYPPEAEEGLATCCYFNLGRQPQRLQEIVRKRLTEPQHKQNIWVVDGIYRSKAMKELWEEIKLNTYTGITFDLYDVGIVFFDPELVKQHYLINF